MQQRVHNAQQLDFALPSWHGMEGAHGCAHLLFAPRYGRDAMHVVVARRYGHAKGFYAVCMMYPPIN